MSAEFDVIIIGGGPTGLACGIEAQRSGLSYLILEKGAVTESIRRFPLQMTFFSTPELLELGEIPFPSTQVRPSRNEALQYYRRITDYFDLNLKLHTPVTSLHRCEQDFEVETPAGRFRGSHLIIATGYFDNSNRLEIPGEDLDHVISYYDEPYRYARNRVAVIGGRNSAVETALELYRHGAEVHLIHRRPQLGDSVKYWVRPDIENRIRREEIRAHFSTVVRAIEARGLRLQAADGGKEFRLDVDFVIKHIGYRPDEALLRSVGIEVDDQTLIPSYDPRSFETNVAGVFVAGSVVCGCETWNIFIENGRAHARPIIDEIRSRCGK